MRLPAVPVVLVERVLDGDDRVRRHEVGVVGGHLLGGLLLALEGVLLLVVELAGRDVERERDVLAELEAGRLDGLGDQVERGAVARQVGGEAALVADAGGQALLLQHRLERVVDLGALLERLAERRRADRRDHELLDVDVGVGVGAAVEDVHHRHRQQVGVGPADVAEQRQPGAEPRRRGPRRGRRRGSRWRRGWPCWACRRGRASPGRRGAGRRRRGRSIAGAIWSWTPRDGLLHALAAVALAAVAELTASKAPVEAPEGTAARANESSSSSDLDLDRGVAARVEDLAGDDGCRWKPRVMLLGSGRTGPTGSRGRTGTQPSPVHRPLPAAPAAVPRGVTSGVPRCEFLRVEVWVLALATTDPGRL